MSLPLPGYVDTGLTVSITGAGTVQLLGTFGTLTQAGVGDWSIQAEAFGTQSISCPTPLGAFLDGDFKVWVVDPHFGVTLVENVPFICQPFNQTFWSSTYTLSSVAGPYRVGVLERVIGGATHNPIFKQSHVELVYALFADESTSLVETFTGVPGLTRWADPGGSFSASSPSTGMTPVIITFPGSLGFGCSPCLNVDPSVHWTGLSFNGFGDTSGLDNGIIKGDGSGAVHAYAGGTASEVFTVGSTFSEDIDISEFGGSSTGAVVRDADGNSHTVPYTGSGGAAAHRSWDPPSTISGTRSFSIDSTWAAAHHFRSDDLSVMLMQAPKSRDGATYDGASIQVESALDVLRPPDAVSMPSGGGFISSDGTKIAVTDTWSNHFSTFDVTASGAHVTRDLISLWKDRVGLGTGGTSNAHFGITEYAGTKHKPGEDIFDWSLYGYLALDIDAPATGDLTLVIAGNHLQVNDPHVTGSGRISGYTATLVPFSYTYTVPATSGRHVYTIDLNFPASPSGPVYLSRVDSATLSGFVPGSPNTYTLYALAPTAQGSAHVKIDYGPPVPGSDYSCIVVSLDGSFGMGNLPDQTDKPDEIGQTGGSLRYVDPLTGMPSGTVQDAQLSLSDFLGQLNGIEGLTCSYDSSASDAYLADSFGNRCGIELVQNIRPLVPYHTQATGSPYLPPCSCQCRQVVLCPGIHVDVFSRWNAGYGGIETLASASGARAPAGTTVTLGGVSAITDAYGWAEVTLPADATIPYTDGTSTLYLRPHDLPRLLAMAPESPVPGIDLELLPVTWMTRAWLKDVGGTQTVKVGRTTDAGATWTDHDVATDASAGATPTLLAHRSGDLFTFYHDASAHARIWRSPIAEPSAWTNVSTLATIGRWPRGAFLPNDDLIVVHYRGTGLVISRSRDFGNSFTDVEASTFGSLPEQLASLRCDRHGTLHLVYVDSTPQVLHSFLKSDGTWDTPTVLSSGDHPSYALGIERAAELRWSGSTASGEPTDEVYGTLPGLTAFDLSALSSPAVQYLGLRWDSRETIWLAMLDGSGDPAVFYLPERVTATALP